MTVANWPRGRDAKENAKEEARTPTSIDAHRAPLQASLSSYTETPSRRQPKHRNTTSPSHLAPTTTPDFCPSSIQNPKSQNLISSPTPTTMKPKSTLRSFLSLVGSSLLAASSLHAADGTWTPTTTNATFLWSDGANWSDGTRHVADGADFTAFFTSNLSALRTLSRPLPSIVREASATSPSPISPPVRIT